MFKFTGNCFLSIAFLLLTGSPTDAQISCGGKPYSFDNPNTVQDIVPTRISLPENLPASSAAPQDKRTGYRFGEEIQVDFHLSNSGIWEDLPDGSRLWRLCVQSQGAQTINLQFDDFYIPTSSDLFIYTPDKKDVAGAFTARNNNPQNEFATALFDADAVILEYRESKQDKGLGRISLSTVVHGRDAFMRKRGRYGSAAGNCHNDVNCPNYEAYHTVKNAVVFILEGGVAHCSGTLINNTANDAKPYLLTANHCIEGSAVSRFVFIFQYESTSCNANSEADIYSLHGAKIVARDLVSDFALLLLNDTVPCHYRPYFAGWNRTGDPPANIVACIHHPSGDLKKISFTGSTFSTRYEYAGPRNTHWGLFWNSGSTEGGSSGSPLLDQNLLIVGQLEGGYSSCNSIYNDHDTDFYGKLSYSWTNNNALDSSKRLDYWLDPIGLNVQTLSGYNACNLSNREPVRPLPESVEVYPNPASDFVRVTATGSDIILSIVLYHASGQKVREKNAVHDQTATLDIASLPSGFYIAAVQLPDRICYRKFVVQR
jgi:hypothetical protein